VKFSRQEIGEIARYLSDKKNFACLSNCRYCTHRAQYLPGYPILTCTRKLMVAISQLNLPHEKSC